jgi:aminopeptidase N
MHRLLLLSIAFVLVSSCNSTRHATKSTAETIALDTVEITASRDNPYRASATSESDLLHTKLEVSFDYEQQYLNGKATLTLKPHFYPQSQLVLDAKGFNINTVAIVKSDNSLQQANFTYDSLELKIDLDRTYLRNEKYSVFISYTAKPNERKSGGSAAITDDKGLYFINPTGKDSTKPIQIWTQGETESNSCWFPTIDKPNQKTTNEIYITRLSKYVSLSNGTLVSSKDNGNGTVTDYWKMDLPHAPYLLMMTIGDFAVIKERWRDVPVTYYVEKKYEPNAKDIFGNTPEMIEFFSQKLGFDYPWPQYAQIVVRDYVSGAMENTSATLHGEFIQRDTRERLDETYEDIISHELFHQWFGDLVTAESWSNIPLNESFATYGEYLWSEYKYGKQYADFKQYENYEKYMEEAATKNVDLIRFYYENREDMFDRHSYEKGGLILHYLRNIVGDDAFFKSLELYLKTNQFKAVEIHQLRLAFEEVTGRDLNWFFNQWFFSNGHPVLDINYRSTADSVYVSIKQKHSTDSKLIYTLPMAIDVWYNGIVSAYNVTLSKQQQTFAFKAYGTPDLIDADAARVVLCVKNENKTTAQWIFQYQHAKNFVARYEALQNLVEIQKDSAAAQPVVKSAVEDNFFSLREYAIDEVLIKEGNTSLYATLEKLATTDKESAVRQSAIRKISKSAKAKEYVDLFAKMIGDSSYAVSSAALKALGETKPTKAIEMAKQFESETNYEMVAAVADVYSKEGEVEYDAFFRQKLLASQGYNKYSLFYYYANFLTRMDKKVVLAGIKEIEKGGINEDSHFVSGAAKGALKRISKSFDEKKKAAKTSLANEQGQTAKLELQEKIDAYDEIVSAANDAVDRFNKKREAEKK